MPQGDWYDQLKELSADISALGRRVERLERRLREENTGPIPGDVGVEYVPHQDGGFVAVYRMLPPEQENDPR